MKSGVHSRGATSQQPCSTHHQLAHPQEQFHSEYSPRGRYVDARRITTQAVPDLREHGIPDEVSAVIARAMSRTPGQRPATAADFGEQLRGLQRDHGFPVDEMALRAEADAQGNGEQPTWRGGRLSQPSSTPGATGSLPLELTSFVGRRHELTEAKNLLAGSRLVTLTGIGGVGKTRLAMRVASAVQRDYADGVPRRVG